MDVQGGNALVGAGAPKFKKSREAAMQERKHILGRVGTNGRENLKKLSRRHLTIISLHLEGKSSGKDIAEVMGCSAGTVYSVLQDPISQDIIEKYRQGQLEDIKSLYPLVFEALKDALENGTRKEKMVATGRFQDFVKQADGPGEEEEKGPNQIIDARQQFVQIINQVMENGRSAPAPTPPILEGRDSESS